MEFKKWLEEKCSTQPQKYQISRFINGKYYHTDLKPNIDVNKNILEKFYHLYQNSSILNLMEIDKYDNNNYTLIFPEFLDTDFIFNIIYSFFNIEDIKRYRRNHKLLNAHIWYRKHPDDPDEDIIKSIEELDKFYCFLTLDPSFNSYIYIKDVEIELNKNISQYTNTKTLYKEVFHELKNNPNFRSILELQLHNLEIFLFKDMKAYDNFIFERERSFINISNKNSLNYLKSKEMNIFNRLN